MSQIEAEPAERSLDAFVREEGQGLLRFAFLLTGGHPASAEDLVQTVLLRLTDRGIGNLADPGTYARRCIINEQRSLRRRTQAQLRALSRLRGRSDSDEHVRASEDRLAVLAALEVLSDRQRAAIVLRYYEDLADAEIAEVLGCSRATVRSLVHRAVPQLKQALVTTYPPTRDADADPKGEHHG